VTTKECRTRSARPYEGSYHLPMHLSLVHFEATDGVGLAGLLYEPTRKSDDVVVWLHGNGDSSVFYSSRSNMLGEAITERGTAFLTFNNRGAYMLKRLRQRKGAKKTSKLFGMSHELIRDCIYDIDGAVRYCRSLGYKRVHLVGHSTGANKICVYNFYKPRNPIASYLVLAGGDDSGLYRKQWGVAKFQRVLARCRTMLKARKGDDYVPASLTPFLITWRSLHDTINPDGDYNVFPYLEVMEKRFSRKPLFRHFRSIKSKPTLVLYGENDEYCFDDVPRCMEILREHAAGSRMSFAIMPDADHGFSGKERQLGQAVARWVRAFP
jgi:pimeloyl-ACP methyl ester carboxylesterase